jgi:pSer/pThr/pTyr-binding forkhead associated (FHA) protein
MVKVGGREFVLPPGETVLGREPSAGVCVDHPSVSRLHARISIEAGRAWIEDLGSRNGTFLNGRRIDGSTEIEEEGIIGLGPVTLEFFKLRAPASTRSMSGRDVVD